MKPGKYNILCPQGTTYAAQFTYSINDTPVNLTGYNARLQVREFHYSPDFIIGFDSIASSALYVGGSAGTIDLNIPPTSTEWLIPGDYVYDLEIYTSTNVYRLIEGKFTVSPEVTR